MNEITDLRDFKTAVFEVKKPTFEGFGKIARWSKDLILTEKLDGTNAQILITEDDRVFAGSRTHWITPEKDNYGFARWVKDNESALKAELGHGRFYGEWFGAGIQRRYGLKEKRFSLFDTRFTGKVSLCGVVPVLYEGPNTPGVVEEVLQMLKAEGSRAAPGFMDPEGIIIFHTAQRSYFKKTFDDGPKGE